MAIYKEFAAQSVDTLHEAHQVFGDDLRVLTSFGTESALTLRLIREARIPLRGVTIDTGFLFPETEVHKRQLQQVEAFHATTYGVSDEEVIDIANQKLWVTDKDAYHRRTKLEPLSLAIEELGIQGLITGIRRAQTENREGLDTYQTGRDGEVRVNPILDWTDEAVEAYFVDKGLLRHPLHYQGYGSVGDWTLTVPGKGREGRNLGALSECGIHILRDVDDVTTAA